MTIRRLSGLEILAVVVATLFVLLAVFMFVMAIVASANPSVRRTEGVSVSQAWTAALVASVIASGAARLVSSHLHRAFPRRRT
jgi:hypothetical protein